MKRTILTAAAVAALALGACETSEPQRRAAINPDVADQPAPQGLVAEDSTYDFETTVSRIRAALEARPVTVFATVDHAAGARDAGLELEPSTLFVFGSPTSGTPLMQANPALGLELPMKIVVVQTDNGVQILRQNITALTRQYGLAPEDVNAASIESTLSSIVAEAGG